MTSYRVHVDGRPYDVGIEDEAPGRCRVTVDGHVFAVEFDAVAAASPPAAARADVRSGSPPAAAAQPLAEARAVAPAGDAAVLRAPMPGCILRVAVAPGARVQRGQDIAVLEAMKMENIVRAPQAGTIAEVFVAPGDQIAHGVPIVRFEAGGAAGAS
jgi:biotin carboxyl carrier protein